MKKIPLTQGKFALVDDCDYEFLSQWNWYAANHGHTFYVRRKFKIDGQWVSVYMHQEIACRLGFPDTADHINRNGLDNRRSNLRNANPKQQVENRGLQRNNTSGYKGISWFKRDSKWRARIKHNGKDIHLGLFDTFDEAVKARKEAEDRYFTLV